MQDDTHGLSSIVAVAVVFAGCGGVELRPAPELQESPRTGLSKPIVPAKAFRQQYGNSAVRVPNNSMAKDAVRSAASTSAAVAADHRDILAGPEAGADTTPKSSQRFLPTDP